MTSVKDLLANSDKETLDRIARSIKLGDNEVISEELLEDIITPNYIGPTWATDEDGNWVLPEHTLGWEIAGWCTKWLRHPGKPEEPWRFTPEQLRFVLWWYALDAEGNFKYQSGVLQRRKGWLPGARTRCLLSCVSWRWLAPVGSTTGMRTGIL